MTIIKEIKNDYKEIDIAQGNELIIDTDIMVCVIDELTDQKHRNEFAKKYGNEMLGYIERNFILSELMYFMTPGFNFRSNFVFFLIKNKITKKDQFLDTLFMIHQHGELNFSENITFPLDQMNQLNLGERRKSTLSILFDFLFTDEWKIKTTVIDNIRYNVEKTHDSQIKKLHMKVIDPKTKPKKMKDGSRIMRDAKQKRVLNGTPKEDVQDTNELLNLQGSLFCSSNMLNILSEIVENL